MVNHHPRLLSFGNERPCNAGRRIHWDRGRPARNEREARRVFDTHSTANTSRLRRVAGQTAAGPCKESFSQAILLTSDRK
jgi:hypothetical protein